ncbi:outer membrane beta-barrel protein [Tellurirhabdus bombi]|uniref:outer membrane beta-barrel protein n=1 Tax=Tellurirhabdus bombi TaxID=2907205 RepID=UPI001F38DE95|nr:outer membrane beta-barrel family protein [Tellurirhabdus bombi]
MRKLLLLLLLAVSIGTAMAQQAGRVSTAPRVNIKGTVVDTVNAALPAATVMLLTPKDSTLVNFGRTNDKGTFEFRNVKAGSYLLKITFVGYLPYQQEIHPGSDQIMDMGNIKLKPITRELFEVVIKAAKAPLMIRGDTIEYNVSSFKVPPGATVEDLLRKLPGVSVDQDGNIQAQGQSVNKVTVDGKLFFGSDPKQATKNLPAEALSRVQVFNDKTEQSKLTGINDGKIEKTLNLELKESHKKGGFGKFTAGAGPQSKVAGAQSVARTEVRGNYNRFNTKEQFSVIGMGNNVNQTGLSGGDYQDFRGSQSYNWGDNADFGFSNGGRVVYFSDDGDGGFSIPQSYNRGRGFSNNFAGGANYNYDTKKFKASSSYFYNQMRQTLNAENNRENFLPDKSSFGTNDNNSRINFSANHRFSLRVEQNIDSLNTLILIANGRMNNGNDTYRSQQVFSRRANPDSLARQTSETEINNNNQYNSLAFITSLIYRHKFKKKGRQFAASGSFSYNNTEGSGNQISRSRYIGSTTSTETLPNINQSNATDSRQNEFKSSLLFIEPLSKRFTWESFYNFSLRYDEVDRDVFNQGGERPVRNDTLSRYYTNDYLYNRLGTGLRYSYKGLNVSVGLAGQQFRLNGQFAADQTSTDFKKVDRTFNTFVPSFGFSYDLKNNRYTYVDYSADVQMPNSRDLQPVIDNSNPRYIREGNPNLLPQMTHRVYGGFHMFNPATFMNISASLNYSYNQNQIVYNQLVDTETLVTTVIPGNISSGGQNYGTYLNFGFPLKKTKATMNFNSSLNFGQNPVFVNNVRNETNSNNYGFGTRLDLTPTDNFTFYANANWNITNTRYSINTTQNQRLYNYRYSADANLKLPSNFYLNGNFNYQVSINRRFAFDQRLPILNLSVYKIFLKDNRGELRFTAYDVFKRNLGVNQNASLNFVSTERVQTLSRYFMLSFSYNIRGMRTQIRR